MNTKDCKNDQQIPDNDLDQVNGGGERIGPVTKTGQSFDDRINRGKNESGKDLKVGGVRKQPNKGVL